MVRFELLLFVFVTRVVSSFSFFLRNQNFAPFHILEATPFVGLLPSCLHMYHNQNVYYGKVCYRLIIYSRYNRISGTQMMLQVAYQPKIWMYLLPVGRLLASQIYSSISSISPLSKPYKQRCSIKKANPSNEIKANGTIPHF